MRRPLSFYLLSVLIVAVVVFLYAPTITIVVLSFQGPNGGLTFPMNGVSLNWYAHLFGGTAEGNIGPALIRSVGLAGLVTITSTVIALAAGLSFRRRYFGSTTLLYLAIASLTVPSTLIGLGIGLLFNQLGIEPHWYTSGFGAQLTWTLPFGVLITLAVFNRFNRSWEEAARDLGASPWATFWQVVMPIIAPAVTGIAMLSFSLSYDEYTRTALTAGFNNTLPLEISSMTARFTSPILYALGSATTVFSLFIFGVVLVSLSVARSRLKQKPPTSE